MRIFFIDRPVFAAVLSIVTVIVGAISIVALPIAQYPDIAPPTVTVTCAYPGANAKTVAETVATPIEEQVNGVEGMLYMSSQSTNDGSMILTVTFKLGTDLDIAQVQVQNRVAIAQPLLPFDVQRAGIVVKKASPNITLGIAVYSPDKSRDPLYLSNFVTLQVKDELARLPGVGDLIDLWRARLLDAAVAQSGEAGGSQHDRRRYHCRGAGAESSGGGRHCRRRSASARDGRRFNTRSMRKVDLIEPSQFDNIVVKTGADGSVTRLKDVARVDLGAADYTTNTHYNGLPAVGIGVFQLPGSNSIATANAVYKKLAELKENFPAGVDYAIPYDTTTFVRDSIRDVVKTLFEAIALVALVVLVFLQNWRASLVPLLAIPVSIVGTFAVMSVFGFSLNNLSMFGLVLAIGIVVDDAIVVVENVDRWIEKGLSPREASYRAMEEVTPAVIAIACGLTAVFVPVAFISGITGQFYRQFALTISFSTLLSAFNSLTLSPALAALILKPHKAKRDWLTRIIDLVFGWFFRLFNIGLEKVNAGYVGTLRHVVRLSLLVLVIYAGLLFLTYLGFTDSSDRFYPGAGPRISDRCAAVARCVVDRSHGRGAGANVGDRGQNARH